MEGVEFQRVYVFCNLGLSNNFLVLKLLYSIIHFILQVTMQFLFLVVLGIGSRIVCVYACETDTTSKSGSLVSMPEALKHSLKQFT